MASNQAPAPAENGAPASVTGEQIRRIRHALGWSQPDLARAMHIDFQTVARWERGKQAPSRLALITLRRVLMVPEVAAALDEALRNEVAAAAAAEGSKP